VDCDAGLDEFYADCTGNSGQIIALVNSATVRATGGTVQWHHSRAEYECLPAACEKNDLDAYAADVKGETDCNEASKQVQVLSCSIAWEYVTEPGQDDDGQDDDGGNPDRGMPSGATTALVCGLMAVGAFAIFFALWYKKVYLPRQGFQDI
jgi:hypothetical protein